MSNIKPTFQVIKNLSFITQFGFSLVTPILLMIWLSLWLRDTLHWGDWVVIVGILLGIVSAFYSAVEFYNYACRQAKKSEDGDNED